MYSEKFFAFCNKYLAFGEQELLQILASGYDGKVDPELVDKVANLFTFFIENELRNELRDNNIFVWLKLDHDEWKNNYLKISTEKKGFEIILCSIEFKWLKIIDKEDWGDFNKVVKGIIRMTKEQLSELKQVFSI